MTRRRREPIEMLLRLLLAGERIKHEDYEYAMAGDCSLCVVMYNDAGEESAHKVDCDISSLKVMADRIGRNELWMRCCAVSLRESQ